MLERVITEKKGARGGTWFPPRQRQMSSGRTGTRVSGRRVAARMAERIAAVETTVGGSPTPLTPYGASGSGTSTSSIATGGMSSVVGSR